MTPPKERRSAKVKKAVQLPPMKDLVFWMKFDDDCQPYSPTGHELQFYDKNGPIPPPVRRQRPTRGKKNL